MQNKKTKLNKLVPTGSIFDNSLRDTFWVELIYGSSVVEGVTLKKSEVEEIVKLGKKSKLLQGNPRADLLQVYGQKLVLQELEKWAKAKKLATTKLLQEMHYMVFEKLDVKAGQFRENYVKLRSSALLPSFPFAISVDMRDFNDWLVQVQKGLDNNDVEKIVELIAKVYHQITKIHPFSDGNGRTARLFINFLLRKYNLPYISVPKVDNEKKMRAALRAADMGDLTLLIEFKRKLLEQSLQTVNDYQRLKGLGKLG